MNAGVPNASESHQAQGEGTMVETQAIQDVFGVRVSHLHRGSSPLVAL